MNNIWASLSIGVIFATMALQFLNFKIFHKDGRNSTRLTLIIKEIMFLCHGIMVIYVTDVVKANFSPMFGNMFGVFWFSGLCCWFFVFVRGLIHPTE
jgi:hypothetical protein